MNFLYLSLARYLSVVIGNTNPTAHSLPRNKISIRGRPVDTGCLSLSHQRYGRVKNHHFEDEPISLLCPFHEPLRNSPKPGQSLKRNPVQKEMFSAPFYFVFVIDHHQCAGSTTTTDNKNNAASIHNSGLTRSWGKFERANQPPTNQNIQTTTTTRVVIIAIVQLAVINTSVTGRTSDADAAGALEMWFSVWQQIIINSFKRGAFTRPGGGPGWTRRSFGRVSNEVACPLCAVAVVVRGGGGGGGGDNRQWMVSQTHSALPH